MAIDYFATPVGSAIRSSPIRTVSARASQASSAERPEPSRGSTTLKLTRTRTSSGTKLSWIKYLSNPKQFMPGTKMIYPGMKDAEQRKALIAYLRDPK
jgi:hypothetical protein